MENTTQNNSRFAKVFNSVLSSTAQSLIDTWYKQKERDIADTETAHETVIHHSPEDRESQLHTVATVVTVAGQFNTSFMEHVEKLVTAPVSEGRQRHIVALERLYSARNEEVIEEYMEEIELMARKELSENSDRPVILLGFSFGGILSKIIADKLSEEYEGRIGLVTWHSPLDPEVGMLVRAARFSELYTALGYDATYCGNYPVVVLTGTEDGVVPVSTSLTLKESVELTQSANDTAGSNDLITDLVKKIKPKAVPGASHADPLNSDLAMRRVSAALEAVRQAASRFPEAKDDRAFDRREAVLREISDSPQIEPDVKVA